MKPLLFLDVDGVLNVRRYPFAEHLVEVKTADLAQSPFTNSFRGQSVDLTLRIPNAYDAWLAELGEHFELVWATTWEKAANIYISPLLGLGELGVVEHHLWPPTFREVTNGNIGVWKMRSILSYAGDRPFAFIDDNGYGAQAFAESVRGASADVLVIVAAEGLERDHVDDLIAWARGLLENASDESGRGLDALA